MPHRDLEGPAARKREELARDKERCTELESRIKEGESGLKGIEEEMAEVQSAIEKIDLDQAKINHDVAECKRKVGKISADLERWVTSPLPFFPPSSQLFPTLPNPLPPPSSLSFPSPSPLVLLSSCHLFNLIDCMCFCPSIRLGHDVARLKAQEEQVAGRAKDLMENAQLEQLDLPRKVSK